jgi:hypothetical protein
VRKFDDLYAIVAVMAVGLLLTGLYMLAFGPLPQDSLDVGALETVTKGAGQ